MPRYQFYFELPANPELGVQDFFMDIENQRLEKIVKEARGDWDAALKKLAKEYLDKIYRVDARVVNYRKVS